MPGAGRPGRDLPRTVFETDWDRWAIVDVVRYDDGEVAVHRYRERAPPLDSYDDDDRHCEVSRVTRPLLRRVLDVAEEELP